MGDHFFLRYVVLYCNIEFVYQFLYTSMNIQYVNVPTNITLRQRTKATLD